MPLSNAKTSTNYDLEIPFVVATKDMSRARKKGIYSMRVVS